MSKPSTVSRQKSADPKCPLSNAQINLVNHVWRACTQEVSGNKTFWAESLVKQFLPEECDWLDAFLLLARAKDMEVKIIEDVISASKLLSVQVNPVYSSPEYKKLQADFHKLLAKKETTEASK